MLKKLYDLKNYLVSMVYSGYANLWFSIRLHALCLWYGGEENVPKEKLDALDGEDQITYMTTLYCLCAYNQVCIRLNVDRDQCYTGAMIYALFNSGIGLSPSDLEKNNQIFNSQTKRRTVLEFMIEHGDIRRELVAFQISAEERVMFEEWLDADDAAVFEAEPKIQPGDDQKQI